MAMIFGWMGRSFGKLGASGKSKFSSGPAGGGAPDGRLLWTADQFLWGADRLYWN